MSNTLQPPFSDIVGESSPVQQTIKLLWSFIDMEPYTDINTSKSNSSSLLILTHILGLMSSAGMINVAGLHSSSIALFRAIEDATDCFAAVALNHSMADKWAKGQLKASDAAKYWTDKTMIEGDINLSDYRKLIRLELNEYSHCRPKQTHWNIYLEKINNKKCICKLNTKRQMININAYYIDTYLCIHLFELLGVIFNVYTEYMLENQNLIKKLIDLRTEIEKVIVKFLEFINEKKIDISMAPEINRIKE